MWRRVGISLPFKLDRFSRNSVDDALLTAQIKRSGAKLVSVAEQLDHETPHGWMLHRMLATYAEYEIRVGGERVKVGMEQKAKLGGTPGKPPIGYKNIREDTASSIGRCTVPVMMTGAVDQHRPMETPGCQARRCRCPNARRSLAR